MSITATYFCWSLIVTTTCKPEPVTGGLDYPRFNEGRLNTKPAHLSEISAVIFVYKLATT